MQEQRRDQEEAQFLREEAADTDDETEEADYYDFDEELRENEEEQAAIAQVEAAVAADLREHNLLVDLEDVNIEEDQEEGAEDPRFPDVIPDRVLAMTDPDRMQITATERQRALAIKRAISNDPEIDPVSDFMCAQMALIVRDDIEGGLERLLHMQEFREEYDIKDTAVEAVQIMTRYLTLMPGSHLSFSYNYDEGNYVMIFDNAKFTADTIQQHDRHIRTQLAGSYYSLNALCPDLEAVRKGSIFIIECEG